MLKLWTCALSVGAIVVAGVAAADTYTRKGDQKIEVTKTGGKLYCTRVSDGFELCNGMTEKSDGSWGGKKMKHPDMPKWMSFNGTVVFGASDLSIKGCAVGVCDSETWAKQ
ncbi:MAG: hypothetical protein ACWA5A_08460 [Marinibacterium sp.]